MWLSNYCTFCELNSKLFSLVLQKAKEIQKILKDVHRRQKLTTDFFQTF